LQRSSYGWLDDGTAAAEPVLSSPVLADGVAAGGQITGQARTLWDALARRGLDTDWLPGFVAEAPVA
jgi:hypothetical protein